MELFALLYWASMVCVRVFACASIACTALLLSPAIAAAHTTIRITDNGFAPQHVTLQPGDTVLVFVNAGDEKHWPASDAHPTHTHYPGSDIRKCGEGAAGDIFDACRGLDPGQEFQFSLTQSGTWKFHDHLHPRFVGSVTVLDDAQTGVGAATSSKLAQPEESLDFTAKVAAFLQKKWYAVFPAEGTKRLHELNMMTVSLRDSDLEYWMRVFDHSRLLDELAADSLLQDIKNANKEGQCHTEAHFLGRMASRLLNWSALNEKAIDRRCQFGFYHGIIESLLGDDANDEVMREFGEACAKNSSDPMRRVFCEHAIGHALMVYYGNDLPLVLKKCSDLFSTVPRSERMCDHGAFMENVFAAVGIGVGGHESNWIDTTRPDFPCLSPELPKHRFVLEQCYVNQSILWGLPVDNFNQEEAFKGCLRAPGRFRSMCFGGVGLNMSLLTTKFSVEEIVKRCESAPTDSDRRDCLIGAAFYQRINSEADDFRNQEFCTALHYEDLDTCQKYISRVMSWALK